jgi:hypothetical protein
MFTIGSRGEVPGKRKPVIREQQQQHDDNNNNNNNPLLSYIVGYFSSNFSALAANY